jgi:hypothetical protein
VSDFEGISLKRKVLVHPRGIDLIILSGERESYKLAVRVCRCSFDTFTHPTISKYWGFRITVKSYEESKQSLCVRCEGLLKHQILHCEYPLCRL